MALFSFLNPKNGSTSNLDATDSVNHTILGTPQGVIVEKKDQESSVKKSFSPSE